MTNKDLIFFSEKLVDEIGVISEILFQLSKDENTLLCKGVRLLANVISDDTGVLREYFNNFKEEQGEENENT